MGSGGGGFEPTRRSGFGGRGGGELAGERNGDWNVLSALDGSGSTRRCSEVDRANEGFGGNGGGRDCGVAVRVDGPG